MRHPEILVLLCAAALASGCATRRIVRAAPPSVSNPPVEEAPPAPEPAPPVPAETKTEPTPDIEPVTPPPVPAKRPAAPRPRPAPAEAADAPAPKPAPPQISPELSPQALAAAQSNTNSNISTSQKNLQMATGKRLNAAQKDLVEKIQGFLAQAQEAIMAEDWIRAQNLADKARVLSLELVKSL